MLKRPMIRWLRPEFQNPSGDSQRQKPLAMPADEDEADEISRRALAPGSKRAKSTQPATKSKSKNPAKRP